jgi:hypothetical protein
MNCRKFETIINDLVRASVMDAEIRTGALAHAENCARCASRLADERALTLGLRAMSASMATKKAPARVEAALLAAFRVGVGGESTQPSLTTPVVVAMPQTTRRRTHWHAAAAIAAAILVAVTLSLFRLHQPPASSQPDSPQSGQQANLTTPLQSPQTPSRVEVDDALPRPDVAPSEVASLNRETTRPRRIAQSYQTASLRGSARRSNVSVNPGNPARTINAASNAGGSAGEREIVTDFMPLTYDSGALAMESGHVVRVELPRSALVSMGLPMNLERAGEPVKADVLMGDDGVARAIRFVR